MVVMMEEWSSLRISGYFIFAFLSDQTLCITNPQSSPFLLQKCNTTLYSLASIVYHLISIIKYRLILSLLLDLLVLTHKRESHAPRGQRAEERESGGCGQGEGVAPTIGVSPEILWLECQPCSEIYRRGRSYRSPDERCVTRRDDDRESNCPLLLCLTACSTDPAENDTVYSVYGDRELAIAIRILET